ncbi:hypothetical protein FisN_10Hu379 [Fistulifera solaris]|uniref:Uncharacterized protein n=1 Tax=Fistulifera solaris TaxID=1519565 RepID=A0A1Z5JQT9_FISSO|nr:hypothetical protein FisN_10Hu379 [Fistulifera solaris]|eukprot:GAX16390.1 hypothetical protein FisN_10Hu379 [Fistulifera solaris]
MKITPLALVTMAIASKPVFTQVADWEPCTTSSDCASATSCCTGSYSGGVLKCSPLEAGFDPAANGCVDGAGANGSEQVESPYIASTRWNCYQEDPIVFRGSVDIWWGHETVDGSWACDEWIADCKANGGCRAIKYSTESETGEVTVEGASSCVGNGGTCTAVYGDDYSITLGSFSNDATFEQVMGCGGEFGLTSFGFGNDGKVISSSAGFEAGQVYSGWEGCCAAAGDSLEQRGLLSSGWFCAKNANWGAVGIYLLGKTGCYGANTRCLAGTSCNFCCNGSRWVWEWFGDHCN